jgi:hypothetical protein
MMETVVVRIAIEPDPTNESGRVVTEADVINMEALSAAMLNRDFNVETPGARYGGIIKRWGVERNHNVFDRLELVLEVDFPWGMINSAMTSG